MDKSKTLDLSVISNKSDDESEGIPHEWNNKLENSIQSLGELSLGYKWMHCEIAKDYAVIYDRLMYSSIALGPVVGVINTANQTFGETTVIPFLITIFSFLTGVLAGIIKFCDYESKISNHKAAAARYTSLANNARIQLNLERHDREDSKQYIIWYTTNYGNLFESSPMLPDYIMLKWKRHAQIHGFKIPGEVGILMDRDDSNEIKKEITDLRQELARKNSQLDEQSQFHNLSTSSHEQTDHTSHHRVRLNMYKLGGQRYTDFNSNDLARFNKILMKKEILGQNSARASQLSSRQSTTRTSHEDSIV